MSESDVRAAAKTVSILENETLRTIPIIAKRLKRVILEFFLNMIYAVFIVYT